MNTHDESPDETETPTGGNMKTTLTGAGALLMTVAAMSLASCHDSVVGPKGQEAAPGLFLTYGDGEVYHASGTPSSDGVDLTSDPFAVAFPDSVGGYVIAGFQKAGGSRGDLFVLQLTERRTGSFGPCGPDGSCHGALLQDYDGIQHLTFGPSWQIAGGTVQVDTAGPDRLAGTFADLVLQAVDSGGPASMIQSGTFHLELLTSEEGKAALSCFLSGADSLTFGGTCGGSAGGTGPGVSFDYADGTTYGASGSPSLDEEGNLVASEFAAAAPAGDGGLVVAGLQARSGTQGGVAGDLFVLRLADARTGSFGPCGDGAGCSGEVLESYDATRLRARGPAWKVVGGSVQVDTVTSERVAGTFTGLVLRAQEQPQDSARADRTIESGTFYVDLLPEGATASVECFVGGAGAGCRQGNAPGGSELSLAFTDGGAYHAEGPPRSSDGHIMPGDFATALTDSVGDRTLAGFLWTDGAPADAAGQVFVVSLGGGGTGSFGPCGPGESCHGRLVRYDVATGLPGLAWEIVGGSVQVDAATPDRLQGTFTNLVLQAQDSTVAQDSIPPARTIESGTFNVRPLSEGPVADALKCFLAPALGSAGC